MMKRTTTSKLNQPPVFSLENIRKDLLINAKAVGIPEGAAQPIATLVAEKVAIWAAKRSMITSDDLNRKIASEAEKYSADLAYVYKNRGTII